MIELWFQGEKRRVPLLALLCESLREGCSDGRHLEATQIRNEGAGE